MVKETWLLGWRLHSAKNLNILNPNNWSCLAMILSTYHWKEDVHTAAYRHFFITNLLKPVSIVWFGFLVWRPLSSLLEPFLTTNYFKGTGTSSKEYRLLHRVNNPNQLFLFKIIVLLCTKMEIGHTKMILTV